MILGFLIKKLGWSLICLGTGYVFGAHAVELPEPDLPSEIGELKRVKAVTVDENNNQIFKGKIGLDTFWARVSPEGKVLEVELHSQWGSEIQNPKEENYIKQVLGKEVLKCRR